MLQQAVFHSFRATTLRTTFFPQQAARLPRTPFPRIQQPTLSIRYASQWPNRGQHGYNRFARAQQVGNLWKTSPMLRQVAYVGAGGVVVFVAANIEEVPESKRKRFNWVSPEYERQVGEQTYRQVLQQYQHQILPSSHPSHRLAERIISRLLPHADLPADAANYTIHVIDSPECNAFVIPGGHVFVFTGILSIAKNEGGLAAVLGHELAHNTAHHSAENLSRVSFLLPIAWAASLVFDISGQLTYWVADLAYGKPGSRRQESEADWIGLMLMSRACYDPREAREMWVRMQEYEKKHGGAVPGFLSTHPTNQRRIQDVEKWLPQALDMREQSECAQTLEWTDGFKQRIGELGMESGLKGRNEGFW